MKVSDQKLEKLLASGQFDKVVDLTEKQIFYSPEEVSPRWYRFLAANKCRTEQELLKLPIDIENSPDMIIIAKYGPPQLRERALRLLEQSRSLKGIIIEIIENTLLEQTENDEIDLYARVTIKKLDSILEKLIELNWKYILLLMHQSYEIRCRDFALNIIGKAFLEKKRSVLDIQRKIGMTDSLEERDAVEKLAKLKNEYEKCYDLFKAVGTEVFKKEDAAIEVVTNSIRKQEITINEKIVVLAALSRTLDEKMNEFIEKTARYERIIDDVRKNGSVSLLDYWKPDEVNEIMGKALDKLNSESVSQEVAKIEIYN